jgi:hypothetical protein
MTSILNELAWWNDTDGGRTKYLERNRSEFYIVHRKSNMDYLRIQLGYQQ